MTILCICGGDVWKNKAICGKASDFFLFLLFLFIFFSLAINNIPGSCLIWRWPFSEWIIIYFNFFGAQDLYLKAPAVIINTIHKVHKTDDEIRTTACLVSLNILLILWI